MRYSMSICSKCHFMVWTEMCLEYTDCSLMLPESMWEMFLLCILYVWVVITRTAASAERNCHALSIISIHADSLAVLWVTTKTAEACLCFVCRSRSFSNCSKLATKH